MTTQSITQQHNNSWAGVKGAGGGAGEVTVRTVNRSRVSLRRVHLSLELDLRISPAGLCRGPVLHLLVRFFTSGPAPGLRLRWSRTPESSGRCRSQTPSRPSAQRCGSEQRAARCWSTLRANKLLQQHRSGPIHSRRIFTDGHKQTHRRPERSGSSHLHAGVGELQVCSRNLQQSVQEPLHLLNQHGGCTAGNTALSSTGPELNILLTLCELCVTDRAPTLSHEFTWKFLLDRLPLGVVRKHEGDLWWGEDSTFSLISLSRLLTDSQRLILL